MSDTVTEVRPVAIERSQGGSISPTNNGIIINWGSGGGGSSVAAEPSSSSPLGFLIGAGIFIMAGALLFQVIAQGVSAFQNKQLQQQNQLLTQQLAAQTAQIEGAKQMLGCKP